MRTLKGICIIVRENLLVSLTKQLIINSTLIYSKYQSKKNGKIVQKKEIICSNEGQKEYFCSG